MRNLILALALSVCFYNSESHEKCEANCTVNLNGKYVNQIDLSNFPNGIYNLTISSRIGVFNYKLIHH